MSSPEPAKTDSFPRYVEDVQTENELGKGRVLARLGQGECDGDFFSILNYIESLSVTLRICTPWTNDAPPRMAHATWTASVISSVLDPFSRQAWL